MRERELVCVCVCVYVCRAVHNGPRKKKKGRGRRKCDQHQLARWEEVGGALAWVNAYRRHAATALTKVGGL